MFNKKEILLILGIAVIFALALSFLKGLDVFLSSLLLAFLVLIINFVSKKVSSFYLDSKIEIKLWEVKRYGFKPTRHFKRAFPAGVLFPLLSSFFTLGNFTWLGAMVFETKPRVYSAAKKHDLYNFSDMT